MGRFAAARSDGARSGRASGFTLVEVLVAMMVFIIVSTATVTVVVQGLRTLRENSDRIMAAAIARSTVEYWRMKGVTGIPVGLTEWKAGGTAPPIAADASFVIRTDAQWIGFNQTSSSCSSSSPGHSYMRLSIRVSSVNLPGPVGVDTVVAPEAKEDVSGKATVAVSVVDQVGSSVDGVHVVGTDTTFAANKVDAVTGSDGCLVFQGLTPLGSLDIVISKSGYVSSTPTGTTASVVLDANTLKRQPFLLAPAASFQFTSAEAEYLLPSTMPVTWQVSVTGTSPNVGAVNTIVSGLWPTGAITAYAGKCTQADPTSYSRARASFALVAGNTTGAPLPVVPVKLRGLTASTTVTAKTADTGCTMSTITVGTSNAKGIVLVGMPYGKWDFVAGGQTQRITVAPPNPPATLPVELVNFTLANLDVTPSPTPSPTGSSTVSPTATPSATVTP